MLRLRKTAPLIRKLCQIFSFTAYHSSVCGVIFDSVERASQLMAKATTQTGLKVLTTVLDAVYQTGRKVTKEFKQTMEIVFDKELPQWNYTAKPQ